MSWERTVAQLRPLVAIVISMPPVLGKPLVVNQGCCKEHAVIWAFNSSFKPGNCAQGCFPEKSLPWRFATPTSMNMWERHDWWWTSAPSSSVGPWPRFSSVSQFADDRSWGLSKAIHINKLMMSCDSNRTLDGTMGTGSAWTDSHTVLGGPK